MTRGFPDFGRYSRKQEIAMIPLILYQSGHVFLHDEFEGAVLNWTTAGGGTWSVALTTARSYAGGNSVLLTTGATAGHTAQISKRVGFPEGTKIGVSLHFSIPTKWFRYFEIEIILYDGTNYYDFHVRYDSLNYKWQYYNSAGSVVDIPSGAQLLYPDPDSWQHMKVIVDLATGKYQDLFVNEQSFDLRALAPYKSASAFGPHALITVRGATDVTAAREFYIDQVTLTKED